MAIEVSPIELFGDFDMKLLVFFILVMTLAIACTQQDLEDWRLLAEQEPSSSEKLTDAVTGASPTDFFETAGAIITGVNPAVGTGILAAAYWWRKMQEQAKGRRLAESTQSAVDALGASDKKELGESQDIAVKRLVDDAQGKNKGMLNTMRRIL
ncbi:hypothetical protein LCGC14_1239910 [marine sediment metagenome]|uniref:Uncharacterized protein n=1 Tax=marine sediment metagenome TaxID=412755 RepID=A0A0F9LAB5_9ZZZZ